LVNANRVRGMETAEKLFERAKHLNPRELSRLIALLEKYFSSASGAKRARGAKHTRELLALSGIADSDYADVSSHKARHLAQAYAPRPGD